MKNFTIGIMAAMLFLTFSPAQMNASTMSSTVSITTPKPDKSLEITALRSRLHEINTMDKSELNPSERKQLRKEKRSIKGQLREVNGGVYLSAGAVILIVLLVLILL